MPFTHTCREHDEFRADALDGILDHLEAEHPGVTFGSARTDLLVTSFVSQVVAQGNKALKAYRCRSCGSMIETYDDDPPEFCANCLEARS